MIYTGLGRVGEIADVKANGGADVAEVYGGIGESNPIFYSRKTLTGTSPLTFKGLGLPLKDYHVFGETVQNGTPSPDYPADVQGCGERTRNLFDWNWLVDGYHLSPETGLPATYSSRTAILQPIEISAVGAFLSFTKIGSEGIRAMYSVLTDEDVLIRRETGKDTGGYLDLSGGNKIYIAFYNVSSAIAATKDNVGNIMLNTGSTALPYEPYGYKIPVTVGNVTTPIYIGADPLYRSGEYADEIDFANQRIVRRIDPTTMQPYATPITSTITVPQLTAAIGDNTLTVGTTVKPSAVSITGNIKPTGYGQLVDVNGVQILDKDSVPIYVHGQQ